MRKGLTRSYQVFFYRVLLDLAILIDCTSLQALNEADFIMESLENLISNTWNILSIFF